jgi:hypothetical protein
MTTTSLKIALLCIVVQVLLMECIISANQESLRGSLVETPSNHEHRELVVIDVIYAIGNFFAGIIRIIGRIFRHIF